jgi:CMP/dCMP kinase
MSKPNEGGVLLDLVHPVTERERNGSNRERRIVGVAASATSNVVKMREMTSSQNGRDETATNRPIVSGRSRHGMPTTIGDRDDATKTRHRSHSHSLNSTGDAISPGQDGQVHREVSMTRPHEDAESKTARDGETDNRDAEHRRVIAIDGPAAAGKTTVARALADRLSATYLDTGLLYRAVTLAALRAGLAMDDGPAIAKLARQSRFEITPPTEPGQTEQIFVDGENVTPLLRTPEVDRVVSQVSAHPDVRTALLPIQRKIASYNAVIMVGRDITTVVVPHAGVKIFLNASPAERARRRLAERADQGREGDFEEMLRDIEDRDFADSTREVAPLHAGEGVEIVQTEGLNVDQVVDKIAQIVERSWMSDQGHGHP